MNEVLFFIEIIVTFSLLLLAKKLFGKIGVIVWIALASVIANIQVIKNVDLFSIKSTLGNVLFASNFLATDILSECYGKNEAKKGVFMGLFAIIMYLICTQITLLFTPNEIDIAQNWMEGLFSIAPRVCIASVSMYFVSNISDVFLFDKMKIKFGNKKLWFRNNVSTIVCNCLENFAFVFLAFTGVYSVNDVLTIAISTSILEIIVAICDTPFLYMARKINSKSEINLSEK